MSKGLTLDELRKLPVEYVGGHTEDTRAVRWYKNDQHGITMLLVTKRINPDDLYGGWGTGKTYYMFDGSKRQYRSLEAFLRAYNARQE
jgi:hypothetical protein